MSDPRLIVGLDLADADEARRMVETLGDLISFYKIGLTLLAGEGLALSRELKAAGKSVFQDWKLHDIGARWRAPRALSPPTAATSSPSTPSRR
jgi:orotidine-5'-phosphate decarboxylase